MADVKPGKGISATEVKAEMIKFMDEKLGWKVKGDNPFLAVGFAAMFEHFTKLILEHNKVDVNVDGKPGKGKFS